MLRPAMLKTPSLDDDEAGTHSNLFAILARCGKVFSFIFHQRRGFSTIPESEFMYSSISRALDEAIERLLLYFSNKELLEILFGTGQGATFDS